MAVAAVTGFFWGRREDGRPPPLGTGRTAPGGLGLVPPEQHQGAGVDQALSLIRTIARNSVTATPKECSALVLNAPVSKSTVDVILGAG